jgi:hypothetical protein
VNPEARLTHSGEENNLRQSGIRAFILRQSAISLVPAPIDQRAARTFMRLSLAILSGLIKNLIYVCVVPSVDAILQTRRNFN